MSCPVLMVRRDFADGSQEPWRGREPAWFWREYIRDMLTNRLRGPTRTPTAVHLRMADGGLVIVRPRRRAA